MVFALVRMANDMPELFGTRLPRAGLLRRVGRLEQVAGVRLVTLDDGLGAGSACSSSGPAPGFASTCSSTAVSTSAGASWRAGR